MHPALLVAAALSAAVSPLTVDEIVARHTEARGGAQRLAALQNLKISGKAFFGGGEDFAVTAEFAQVRLRNGRLVRLSLDVLQFEFDGRDGSKRKFRAVVPR